MACIRIATERLFMLNGEKYSTTIFSKRIDMESYLNVVMALSGVYFQGFSLIQLIIPKSKSITP